MLLIGKADLMIGMGNHSAAIDLTHTHISHMIVLGEVMRNQ